MSDTASHPTPSVHRKKLGDCLIDAGLIDEQILAKALELQKQSKKRIGQILLDMGVASDEEIAQALSQQLRIPYLDLEQEQTDPAVVSLVSGALAHNYLLVPLRKNGKKLLIAMANPLEFYAIEDLRFATQMDIEVGVATHRAIFNCLEKIYPQRNLAEALALPPHLDESLEFLKTEKDADPNRKDLMEIMMMTEQPPVVRFVNAIISDAIRLRASDVHIDPQEDAVLIRYRIDGIMREIIKTDRQIHTSIVSRIKVIADMDIAVRRKPQDGRSKIRIDKTVYDLRIATIPTSYGEAVTIRILHPQGGAISLAELGLSPEDLQRLRGMITRPQGLILVTGPTGSGKSTTLYSMLNQLNTKKVHIITVEDPVEYDIKGVNQVQINPKAGMTFSSGLRSILRLDPDIIMVGEIRDRETAQIAFQAGQTGHLVLSTLHTNDAPAAVSRLSDMGVDSFLVSAELLGVLSQRLVRRICDHCKAPDPMSAQIIERFRPYIGNRKANFWRGTGCERCHYTGYLGRIGIFELLPITQKLAKVINRRGSNQELEKTATTEGFVTLTRAGMEKALEGLTTVEEILRVAPPPDEYGEEEESGARYDPTDEPAGAKGETLPPPPEETRAPASENRSAPRQPETVGGEPLAISREDMKAILAEGGLPALGHSSPQKLLVVDDNELSRRIIKHFLESASYLALTAENASQALKIAEQERPALIITDQVMPEMDGLTLVKKLRSQLVTRFIPIIMLTMREEVEHEVEGLEAGVDDYLVKPVNAKRLLARIRRLLDRRSSR